MSKIEKSLPFDFNNREYYNRDYYKERVIMSVRAWMIVASKNHVARGVQEGFTQACHGKATPLKRMKEGDWVICYSPKLEFEGIEKCQAFTAIGQVVDGQVFQVDMGQGFTPFRSKINFKKCTEVPIHKMLSKLSLTKTRKNWGILFRRGFFEIPYQDFQLIAHEMLGKNID